MGEPLDEVAFLANSRNRVDVLATLAGDPRTRRELVGETDASRPTIGRILGELEDRSWVERTGRRYGLTPLGRLVVDAFTDVVDAMETEQKLREAVRWLPTERIGFDLALFSDAVVSIPEPGYSHRPVNRFIELVEGASRARGFGIAMLAPASADVLFRKAGNGMDTEIVYPPAVVEEILLSVPEAAGVAVDSGDLAVMVHEDLPCGLYVFDDRVVLGGYDRATGVLRVVVDTGDPDALEWGESIYESYRREARPFDPRGLLGPEREHRSAESR